MNARARRGMTLMELVIGLAITGIMAAAGVAAFGSIIDHRRVIHDASATTSALPRCAKRFARGRWVARFESRLAVVRAG